MGCRIVGCSAEVVQTSWGILGKGQKAEKVDRLKFGAKGGSLGNSLAPHERLTDLAVVPREKPHTGAAAREQPRDSPVIER